MARWVAYDREPELLAPARLNAPHADFHPGDGRGEVPDALLGPFDLIVFRRGPTSVILHLPTVAAPGARFLYVGPTLDVPQVPARLAAVGWAAHGEWRVSVRAWVPTWEDWEARATDRDLASRGEQDVVLAGAE